MSQEPQDITILLTQAGEGGNEAFSRLFQRVYEEVREIAAGQMARERQNHTLQATALAHEAFARLIKDQNPKWSDRRYFFASVGQAMRRILIEHARRHRGKMSLQSGVAITNENEAFDWERLDRALTDIEAEDKRLAEVVHLRYFAGLSRADTARALDVSEETVKRDWAYARARLVQLLSNDT